MADIRELGSLDDAEDAQDILELLLGGLPACWACGAVRWVPLGFDEADKSRESIPLLAMHCGECGFFAQFYGPQLGIGKRLPKKKK